MSLPKFSILLSVLLWGSTVLSAQSCFVLDKSFSGLPDMYEGVFGGKACELKSVLDGEGIAGFSIVLRDYYPMKAYVKPYNYYDDVHSAAMDEVSQTYSSYLFIAKDHLEGSALRYRVELKLPEAVLFDTLSPFQKADIRQKVEDAIAVAAIIRGVQTSFGYNLSSTVALETAAVQKLIDIIRALKEGRYNSAAIMAGAGFEAVPVSGQAQMTASAALKDVGSFDFAGITVSGVSGPSVLLREVMAQAAPDPDLPVQLQQICIITHGGNSPDDLNSADSVFQHNPAHLILWLHLEKGESAATDTMFIKSANNLSAAEAESLVNYYVEASLNEWLPTGGEEPTLRPGDGRSVSGCGTFGAEYGKRCFLGPESSFGEGMAIGLFDGVMGVFYFLYEGGKGMNEVGQAVFEAIEAYAKDTWNHFRKKQSLYAVAEKVWGDGVEVIKQQLVSLAATYKTIAQLATTGVQWKSIIEGIKNGISDWMGALLEGDGLSGYIVGEVCFEMISFAFSGGTSLGAKFLPELMKVLDDLPKRARGAVLGLLNDAESKTNVVGGLRAKISKCKILGTGCFIAGTPVLVAAKSHLGQGKAVAFAATLPLVALPIEEVQLFDYALAHKTVNASHGLTASASRDIPTSISRHNDPYTSDQQRARDRYALDDENWHEVVFEEVRGTSTAKLALHRDWMNDKGYAAGAVVEMHLPEQGISGPFRITSIKHVLPQKRPAEENEPSDFAFQPVTGIFAHRSNDVWTLAFDSGDTLGVTYSHPIYSATAGDWRLAGELEIGEEVLTYAGSTKVVSKQLGLPQLVYNLEVKDYHNFLVTGAGVVVHNTANCFNAVKDLLKDFVAHKRVGGKSGAVRNGNAVSLPDGRSVPISDKEFPDFTGFTARTGSGNPLAKKFSGLKGENDRLFDNNKANTWLQQSGYLNDFDSYWVHPTYGSPVKLTKNGVEKAYTWHHHENGKTMMLVEQSVHNSVQHIGGASLISSGATTAIDDFAKIFPDPVFD